MSVKSKDATDTVVAGVGKHKLVEKRRLMWGGAALVVLLLGFAVYMLLRPYHKPEPPKSVADKSTPSTSAKALQSSVDKYNASQDFAGAVKDAEAHAGKDTQSQLVLAAAYSNNKQYDKAIALYDSLIGANRLEGADIMAAGEVAQLAGNKPKAVEYYQKARTKLAQENGPFSKRQIDYIDRQLAELKK